MSALFNWLHDRFPQAKQCDSNMHSFEMLEAFTGGSKYRCKKCGLTDYSYSTIDNDFLLKYWGSSVGKTSYVWQQWMNSAQITHFEMSSGDYPIERIAFDGQRIVRNWRINGSRDGWMSFPDGFFDDRVTYLASTQSDQIMHALQQVPFCTWQTEKRVMELLFCPGFTYNASFNCVFESGEKFIFIGNRQPEGFGELVQTIEQVCDMSDKADASISPVDQGACREAACCQRCGGAYEVGARFCPWCGHLANNGQHKGSHTEFDFEQTGYPCPACNAFVIYAHRYCNMCGATLTRA